jgi:hypothetical protein
VQCVLVVSATSTPVDDNVTVVPGDDAILLHVQHTHGFESSGYTAGPRCHVTAQPRPHHALQYGVVVGVELATRYQGTATCTVVDVEPLRIEDQALPAQQLNVDVEVVSPTLASHLATRLAF